jgi:predicted nucleotidyltransferase
MTTKSSQKGIGALFASAAIGPLLRSFVLQPQREFYQRELQRLTGAHLRQLQRDLGRLVESGFVQGRVHGNRVYYRAVVAHPAFPALRSLVLTTVGAGDGLREALAGLGAAVEAAFVYGSFARGDESAESDVDLLVVGSVTRRALASALAPAGRELGRELNPVILSAEEFAARRQSGDHFLEAVLAEPRIWLVGDDGTLAALG